MSDRGMIGCPIGAMTTAQRKWLLRALPPHSDTGIVQNYDFSAFGKSNYERMMTKLEALGMVTPYVHGGFAITDLGRRVASGMIGDRAFAGSPT